MPIVDLSKTMTNLDGSAATDDAGKPIPLVRYCEMALTAAFPDEQIDGEEKFKRFKLAVKLGAGGQNLPAGHVLLEPEEIVKVKQLIGKAYGAVVVGRIYDLLNA